MSIDDSPTQDWEELLTKRIPELCLGTKVDEYTDGLLCWRTIQNQRSKGLIPAACFIKVSPRKVFILRDKFLAWLRERAKYLVKVKKMSPYDRSLRPQKRASEHNGKVA